VTMFTLSSVKLISLSHFKEENGELVIVEGGINIPFQILRVFSVRSSDSSIRGHHAHKLCSQFLLCPNGAIQVNCSDGSEHAEFMLDRPNIGLFVPPGIWMDQVYKQENSVLTVLCDRHFEETDYIRDYEVYLSYWKSNRLA